MLQQLQLGKKEDGEWEWALQGVWDICLPGLACKRKRNTEKFNLKLEGNSPQRHTAKPTTENGARAGEGWDAGGAEWLDFLVEERMFLFLHKARATFPFFFPHFFPVFLALCLNGDSGFDQWKWRDFTLKPKRDSFSFEGFYMKSQYTL